ncbi:hypothetical protein NQ318_003548 [Aromia moschata]|uniref:Peptidase S8/S53 domain-containing protein n=1 Tax=Aromia moschata TaxID=1265417 RepID=A0AAV8YX73_9CUCU|nr:hypothetical protein NQ318_003548 [Aromia moschata]
MGATAESQKRGLKRDLILQDSDPKWPSMWYLNRGNGLDMNVIPAWMEGVTGKGAVVTILDDGLEKDHPDFSAKLRSDGLSALRHDRLQQARHQVCWEVAATSNNSVCALGVAHGAQVGGVRMLDGDVTDAVEARSLTPAGGPDDDGKTVDGPGELATRAFIEGVTKGRNGKGSIFIWASGNGGRDHDNCNCAATRTPFTACRSRAPLSTATFPGTARRAAPLWRRLTVAEPSAETSRHDGPEALLHQQPQGTSASAPLAAGICALALEANPNLTWRDMQHIVVRTARPQNLIAPDRQTNGVGRNVSHSFGTGLWTPMPWCSCEELGHHP